MIVNVRKGPLVLLFLFLAIDLGAQEVVKKKRKRIKVVWAPITKTENYLIKSEEGLSPSVVARVGKELEEVLAQYEKLFRYKHDKKFRVKILENLNTYEQEGGDPSHPGFYNPAKNYLVLKDMPFYNLVPTIYHEAFHQYLRNYVGRGVNIPIWFNEGMAVYYEGMQRDKNRGKTLNPKKIKKKQIRMVKDAIRTYSHIPLETLIDADYEQFHDEEKESLSYSSSFSVMYFLMRQTRGKAAVKFAKALRETKSVEAANATLFGKERKRLKRVEKAWKKFTLGLDPETVAQK